VSVVLVTAMNTSRHGDDDLLLKHSNSSNTEKTVGLDNSLSSMTDEPILDATHHSKASSVDMMTTSHVPSTIPTTMSNNMNQNSCNFHASLDFDRHVMASPRRRVGGGAHGSRNVTLEDSELGESFAVDDDDMNASGTILQATRVHQLQSNFQNLVTVLDIEDEEDEE
jgi:hypothetical protein